MNTGTGTWDLTIHHPGDTDFTLDEVESAGVPINKLRDGDWFAFVGAKQQDGQNGLATWTGTIVTKCLGSVLVQLDRGWDDRLWWAPDTKVIKLPHPNVGKRIPLTKFNDEE